MLAMGAWLIALGLVFIVFGRSYPELLRWLGGFILLCGAVLYVLAAIRLRGGGGNHPALCARYSRTQEPE